MMEQTAPSLHPLDFISSQFKQPDIAPRTLKSNFFIGDKLPEKQVDRKDAQRLEIVKRYATPVKSSLYVLAARLHDADTLRAEMLDEEYGALMSRILKIVIATLEQYNGLFCQHRGSGVLGFFLPSDQSENNPLPIIQCALELKARMKELGREWKIRKGWLHDIELNIGISVGNEYLLALPTSLGSNLTCLGNTQSVAICLSDLSTNGQIWATKTLINQIPSSKLTEIRFGLFRGESQRQVFVARSFSRIRDLSDTPPASACIGDEVGCQAVTQIFDYQGDSDEAMKNRCQRY